MKKRMISLLVAMCMVFTLLPVTVLAAGIQSNVPALTVNDTTTTIAFVGHEWYVISTGSGGAAPSSGHLTLLAKDSFGTDAFRKGQSSNPNDADWKQYWGNNRWYQGTTNSYPNEYDDSTLMRTLATATDALPASEAALITARSLDGIGGVAVSGQKLWPLSYSEYLAMKTLSGDAFSGSFWLRTPYFDDLVCVGFPGGSSWDSSDWVDSLGGAIRPALHLNLASVLFTSDASAGGGKSLATVGGDLIGATAPIGKLKFTMVDTMQTLDVIATTAQSTQIAETLAFSYDSATTGTNQYVSCVLEQGGTVTHYGKLADSGAAASGTLSIPLAGVADGVYTLKIFSEQANGDLYTDFASTPVSMDLTVSGGQGTVSNFGGTVLLSDNAGLASVAGQTISAENETGTIDEPKTAIINVANSVAQVVFGDIVASDSTNAIIELYSDSGFSTAAPSITLTEGSTTHLYIKVAAQDGVTALHYDVTVNRAAAPQPDQHNITIIANPTAGGTPTANPTNAGQGTNIKLAANPASGYRFDSWTVTSGGVTVTGNGFTMPDNAVSITANYTYIGGSNPDPGDPTPTYTQRTLTDSTTGVTVSGLFTADATLKVVQNGLHLQGTCTACDEIRKRIADDDYILLLLKDISLSQGFTGDLTLSIPIDKKHNGETVTILHCASGIHKRYTATVKDGKATFTVTSLSPFAVFAKVADGLDDIPKLGDRSMEGWWLLASLSVMGMILTLSIGWFERRKRKDV